MFRGGVRSALAYPRLPSPDVVASAMSTVSMPDRKQHRAFVALGANIGDRAAQIREALERMRSLGSVVSTSFLYQSAPYV
jgi:hypothetical protein